jgi:hypothetical protein
MSDSRQPDLLAASSKHDHGCKVRIKIPESWKVEAEFGGPNDCYRYKLMHRWGKGPLAMIALKNPSGADLHVGDQTVMKTSRMFRRMGYGGQWIANTCAYRHVSPAALLKVEDPVGPRNIEAILEMAAESSFIIIGHGNLPGDLQHHADAMCAALRQAGHKLHVLALTKFGIPMHPLARGRAYVPEGVVPAVWAGPVGEAISGA